MKVSKHENLSAALLLIAAICIIYAPIVFFNKSLQPPLFYPLNGVVETGAYGYEGRIPVNSFNIDMTSGVYTLPSWGRFIGDSYKRGELPLWTPYQASGTPLPEQYAAAVFSPLQILKELFPTKTWDFFVLAQFWIAGFFTYLFLRLLKLSPISSFLGGLFFMFSGSFTWYWANEQIANVVMLIPVLFWSLERLFRNQKARDVVLLAFIFALVILSGGPGAILYGLFLGGSYFVFRVVTEKKRLILKATYFLLILLTFILGLELAAPQILSFVNFLPLSYNIRDPSFEQGGGIQGISWQYLGFIFSPGASEVPSFYRIAPGTGLWDMLGGYTGILPIFLIVLGFVAYRFFKEKNLYKYFFFFIAFALFIFLKHLGLPPFVWLGKLPFFNLAYSQRWGGFTWVFSFVISGAIGFEILKRLIEAKLASLKIFRVCLFFLLIFVLSIFAIATSGGLEIGKQYSVFSLGTNFLASILILVIAGWLMWHYMKTGKEPYGLVLLALFELWFWIPRGYNNLWQVLELILFLIGLAIVIFVATQNKKRWILAGLIVFFLLFSVMDLFAPNGYPSRYDPFTKAPYINFLQEQKGYPRIVGSDGVLMSNLSNVFGLQDVRYINGTSIATYHNFSFDYLRKYRFRKEIPLQPWFTGMPESFPTQNLSCRHLSKKEISSAREDTVINRRLEQEIKDKLPFYSLLGVKYILMPKSKDMNDPYFPLVYQNEINIFENPDVFPRAFVSNQVDYIGSWQDAQEKILEPDFDLRNRVVLEEKIPNDCCKSPGPENNSSATIKDYKNNKVVIEAFTETPGILVLTDVFYPGWEAKIDNQPAKIYRVDGLLRGVYLEPGNHTVAFKYSPRGFKIGLLVSLSALLACGVLLIFFTPYKDQGSSTGFKKND